MPDLKALAEAAKAAGASCHLGEPERGDRDVLAEFDRACTHDAILDLYRERDEALSDAISWQAQAQWVAQDAVDFGKRAEAAEASLSEKEREVERLRAEQDPFAAAALRFKDGLAERAEQEARRIAATLTQEPTNAD